MINSDLLVILTNIRYGSYSKDIKKYLDRQIPNISPFFTNINYDAKQTAVALDIVKNYCDKTGLAWQYGIGIGCGGMIAEEPSNIASHGPLGNVFKALNVKKMLRAKPHEITKVCGK